MSLLLWMVMAGGLKSVLPRVFGHRSGIDALRGAVRFAGQRGISYLTLYAFSSENWSRPEDEVGFLMNLLRHYTQKELPFLNENNVSVSFIGRKKGLPEDIIGLMEELEEKTSENSGLKLILAVNYGAYNEIIDSVRHIIDSNIDATELSDEDIQNALESGLTTADFPNPDLLIRTAGEKRISNFLLWQCAYSEFYFTDLLWPDFNDTAFEDALSEYSRRERRYGALDKFKDLLPRTLSSCVLLLIGYFLFFGTSLISLAIISLLGALCFFEFFSLARKIENNNFFKLSF